MASIANFQSKNGSYLRARDPNILANLAELAAFNESGLSEDICDTVSK